MLLEGRGGGGLKVVVIFGREGQGWGGWGHRRHGRGVGKLGALQEACSGNPPRDVNALSKRGPNPNPKFCEHTQPGIPTTAAHVCPPLRRLRKRCASRLRFDEATGPYRSRELRRMEDENTAAESDTQ